MVHQPYHPGPLVCPPYHLRSCHLLAVQQQTVQGSDAGARRECSRAYAEDHALDGGFHSHSGVLPAIGYRAAVGVKLRYLYLAELPHVASKVPGVCGAAADDRTHGQH